MLGTLAKSSESNDSHDLSLAFVLGEPNVITFSNLMKETTSPSMFAVNTPATKGLAPIKMDTITNTENPMCRSHDRHLVC
jgi:hypothetical protein